MQGQLVQGRLVQGRLVWGAVSTQGRSVQGAVSAEGGQHVGGGQCRGESMQEVVSAGAVSAEAVSAGGVSGGAVSAGGGQHVGGGQCAWGGGAHGEGVCMQEPVNARRLRAHRDSPSVTGSPNPLVEALPGLSCSGSNTLKFTLF